MSSVPPNFSNDYPCYFVPSLFPSNERFLHLSSKTNSVITTLEGCKGKNDFEPSRFNLKAASTKIFERRVLTLSILPDLPENSPRITFTVSPLRRTTERILYFSRNALTR